MIAYLALVVFVAALVWAASYFDRTLALAEAKAEVTHTVSFTMQPQDGEGITIAVNFSEDEDESDRKAKLDAVYKIADDRRKDCHERFMAIVEAERAEKAAQKVQNIK